MQKLPPDYYIVMKSRINKVYPKMSAKVIMYFTLIFLPLLMSVEAAPTQVTFSPNTADHHPSLPSERDNVPKVYLETTPAPTLPSGEPLFSSEELLDVAVRVEQLASGLALKALVMFVPLAWG